VTLNAANTGAITPADGCTLENDARTAGTGAVSFICGPLARATPYSLVFTAASTSSGEQGPQTDGVADIKHLPAGWFDEASACVLTEPLS
jgi:hypothetical protein